MSTTAVTCVLSIVLILNVQTSWTFQLPLIHVEALEPFGMRFWITDNPGIHLIRFIANVNQDFNDSYVGSIDISTTDHEHGRMTAMHDATVNVGDVINYSVVVNVTGEANIRVFDKFRFRVTGRINRYLPYPPPLPITTPPKPECNQTATNLRSTSAYADQTIFNDNNSSRDEIWRIEHYNNTPAHSMIFDVKGVLAPVFTPFTDSGDVAVAQIPAYMKYLNDHHINGVLVGGTTGEGMSLSVIERKLVLEAWVAAAKPFGATVIAQVGGAPLPDVLELAKHAEEISVDAIITLPELYYKPRTVEQLVAYLQRISEAAPSLPLIYYHFPMMTGVDVNMQELFQKCSSELQKFKGMKADLSVAELVADQMKDGKRIFIANHHIAESVLMGHESSIATVSNVFPRLVFNIASAVKEDVIKAKVLQERLNKLVRAITSQGHFVSTLKYAMEIISGLNIGSVRPPLPSLTNEQKQEIQESLKALKNLYEWI